MADSLPSFTRGLYAGAIHDARLLPFPPSLDRRDPDEARTVHRVIRDLRALVGDVIDPAAMDEAEAIPDAVITALGQIGLLGLGIPREYGGLGLSNTGYARVFGALAQVDASLSVLVGVHCGLGSKSLVLFGSEAQKAHYLPKLASGAMLAAYALSEPETGSDAQHLVSRAEPHPAGGWVLNAHKIWIGLGARAGVMTVFAQTPVTRRGETVQRPTAFLVHPDDPGFHVAGTYRKLGIRASSQAELVFRGVHVPPERVLGEVGKGFGVAVNVLNAGRLTLAAGCTNGAKALLGEFTGYAAQRVQFGKPLADFEITQRKAASLAADVYAADAMVGLLAAAMDRPGEDCAMEAAICKVFCSELIWRSADEMVQLAGGRGYVKPHPYERWLRDARINRIFEGANEILRLFISLNGIQGPAEKLAALGSALRTPLKSWGMMAEFAADRVKGIFGASDRFETPFHPRLSGHAQYFEKHVTELKAAVDAAVTKHRKQIIERQFVLERLAEMGIQLFSTAAVLSRTQALLEQQGEPGSDRELELCDLYCVEAGRRFRAARLALDAREDEVDDRRRAVAGRLREAKGWWVPDAMLPDEAGPMLQTDAARAFGGATVKPED
jgi:alkylation response protein AidB-like acyl-CoA dehydrogenase